jgi:hypothetical protein
VVVGLALALDFSAHAAPEPDPFWLVALSSVLFLLFPTVGALIASRRPDNAIGWLFCALGAVFAVGVAAEAYSTFVLARSPSSLPGEQVSAWLAEWTSDPALFVCGTFLLLLFPDGRLLSPRWKWVGWLGVAGLVMFTPWNALRPGPLESNDAFTNPVGVSGVPANILERVGNTGGALLLAAVSASIVAVVLRFIRAKGEQRQQLKWFAYSATLAVGGFVLAGVFGELRWDALNSVAWFLGVAGLFSLPIAVGTAILKYRLYDIDIIINRTLVYGALTVVLALVYVAGVFGVGGLLRDITGEERNNLVVAASTLAVAGLFRPARSRIQAFIDRRFYRSKYNATQTLEAFSARLRDEVDLDAMSGDLVEVVRETMQPSRVSLWLRTSAAR